MGVLSASFNLSQAISWTNRDQIDVVDRTQPLTIAWSGASADRDIVLVAGASRDVPNNAAGLFLCAALAGDGSFTVPPFVLAVLPKSSPAAAGAAAEIAVGAGGYLNPQEFSGPGLDAGFVLPGVFFLKSVIVP